MKKLRGILIVIAIMAIVLLIVRLNHKQIATDAKGWNLILVNEDYVIPETYKVELVELDNGEFVDERIQTPLLNMFEAAENDGVYMIVADGYRSFEEQKALLEERTDEYQEKVFIRGIAKWIAGQWVAIPGTSEHQLGIAVDINADAIHSSGQEVYEWLSGNAHEYGFIQRYPENKSHITGIKYEPWHYRYVGDEAAETIFNKKLCLEEYLENHSQ